MKQRFYLCIKAYCYSIIAVQNMYPLPNRAIQTSFKIS